MKDKSAPRSTSTKNTIFVIIAGLLILWVGLLATQIFLIEKSFTLLSHNYDKNIFYSETVNNPTTKVLTAEFKSKDDYLGIVSINFDIKQKKLDGQLIFKIKEKGEHDWYYQNTYDIQQLNVLSFYPFGFPIIDNSKGKTYIVQVELDKENQHNSYIKLGNYSTVLATFHKFPKAPLLENKHAFLGFLSKKIANLVDNNSQIFALTIYLYPLVFYIFWRFGKNKVVHVGLITLLFLSILYDSFFIIQVVDLAYITIATLWVFLIRKLKNAPSLSFNLGFVMLGLSILSQFFGTNNNIEKCASWAFVFIFIGILQSMIEMKYQE